MVEPIRWTGAQLGDDASCGKERFRTARLKEPLELHTELPPGRGPFDADPESRCLRAMGHATMA